MKALITAALVIVTAAGFAQQTTPAVPVATLGGTIRGNHMENGTIVKPVVAAADILANREIKINMPGWKVVEYKYAILSANKKYWGSFVITGDKLDDKLLAQLKDPDFKKGRIFLENIQLVHTNGRKAVANNIIIDYEN